MRTRSCLPVWSGRITSYAESVKAYNGDEIYLSSVKFYASENGYLRTDLNGAYQTLSGIADVSSDASVNGDFYFAVFGDGKPSI